MTGVLLPPLDVMKFQVDHVQHVSGAQYGIARNSSPAPKRHDGWDLKASRGTPVRAVASGRVWKVDYTSKTYGTQILLRFTYGSQYLFAQYAHLSTVFVEEGQLAAVGTLLGQTGTSGNADPGTPHLHFEIRTGDSLHPPSNRLDPAGFFPQFAYSIPIAETNARKWK